MNSMELSGTLFKAVLQASVAATILGLIVLVLERVLRKRLSPAWLFALYLPVVVRLLWPTFPESPTSIFNLPQWLQVDSSEVRAGAGIPRAAEISLSSSTALPRPQPLSSSFESAGASVATPGVTMMAGLGVIWLGVASILLLRVMAGWWRLRRLLQHDSANWPELTSVLDKLRREFGIARSLTILETPHVQSPCLFGSLRPKVLMPAGVSQHLTTREIRHVILHELAHLKRRDLMVNAVMVVAQTLHWFNPIVWLLLRRMRLQRELACDRMVLEWQKADVVEARAYGETLLKIVQECKPSAPTSALVGILEGEQSVKERLRQLARFRRETRGNRIMGFSLLLMLAALGLSNAQSEKIAPASVEGEQPLRIGASREATKTGVGIKMLEEEWARQKKEVNAAQERVDELRRKLNIVVSLEESGWSVEKDEQLSLQQRLKAIVQEHSYDNALLNHLKTLNKTDRAELRKTLPTALRPPDELLNRYLADLGAAEQKRMLLSENSTRSHPEVRSLSNLIDTINRQIEERIDSILLGLEARKVVAENLASILRKEIELAQERNAERQEKFAPFFKAKHDLENAQRNLDTLFMRILAEKVDAQHLPARTITQGNNALQ